MVQFPIMAAIDILLGRNIVVYDLETVNPVDGKNVRWDTPEKMGISVGCLFDYRDGDFKVYLKDDLLALTDRLNTADLIVGFNIIRFDNNLLRASGYPLLPESQLFVYDVMKESQAAIGWKEGDPHTGGLKLDDHLRANFGERWLKTAHGANAPLFYREGKISRLVTYCLADVQREKMPFERIWLTGELHAGIHGLVKYRNPREAMRPGSLEAFQPWAGITPQQKDT